MWGWHRHIWKIQDKTEYPPEGMDKLKSMKGYGADKVICELMRPHAIITYKCSVCGSEKVEKI